MKELSVLFLIAIVGLGSWALPAAAEKVRLTDAELDGITAGAALTIPPPTSVACCVSLVLSAAGGAMPPTGSVVLGLTTMPFNPKIRSIVFLNAAGAVPGSGVAGGLILVPNLPIVPINTFFIPF